MEHPAVLCPFSPPLLRRSSVPRRLAAPMRAMPSAPVWRPVVLLAVPLCTSGRGGQGVVPVLGSCRGRSRTMASTHRYATFTCCHRVAPPASLLKPQWISVLG